MIDLFVSLQYRDGYLDAMAGRRFHPPPTRETKPRYAEVDAYKDGFWDAKAEQVFGKQQEET